MVIVVRTSDCYSATSVKSEHFGFGTTCPPDSSDEWPHFHVHLLLTWWFVTMVTMCCKSALNRKLQLKESDLCLLSSELLFFQFFHSHIKLHISSIAPKIKALLLFFLHYLPFNCLFLVFYTCSSIGRTLLQYCPTENAKCLNIIKLQKISPQCIQLQKKSSDLFHPNQSSMSQTRVVLLQPHPHPIEKVQIFTFLIPLKM